MARSSFVIRLTCAVPVFPPISMPPIFIALPRACSFRAFYDFVHTCLDKGKVIVTNLHFWIVLCEHFCIIDIACHPRFDGVTAINQTCCHCGELQRRCQHIALTNTANHSLTSLPPFTKTSSFPCLCWYVTVLFLGEFKAKLFTKTKAFGHLDNFINTNLCAEFIKNTST